MNQVLGFAQKLLRVIGTPLSNDLLTQVTNEGSLDALISIAAPDPASYTDPELYRLDSLCTFLRKCELEGQESRLHKEAEDSFLKSESKNRTTNRRLRSFARRNMFNEGLTLEDMRMWDYLLEARRFLRKVLGPLPDQIEPAFSGGSDVTNRYPRVTTPDKLSSAMSYYVGTDITRQLHDHLFEGTPLGEPWKLFNKASPGMISSLTFYEVPGNEFFSVPKDAHSRRGCCMEASGALAFQLGVGRYLKNRYRTTFKVDLADVPSYHQALARIGSWTGHLATIDLSKASDSLTRLAVGLLLPDDWFVLLNSLRAPAVKLRGTWHGLEMFSSMGNGFTFELETLIFHALAHSVVKRRGTVSVFGDDIIVPAEYAEEVIALLRYFGFETNSSKSFISEDVKFRESCGGDFFEGLDVRPFFIKKLPSHPLHWVTIMNQLRVVGLARTAPWWFCYDQLPKAYRNFGPAELGDTVIHDDPPYLPTITVPVREPHRIDLTLHAKPGTLTQSQLLNPGLNLEAASVPRSFKEVRFRDSPTYGLAELDWSALPLSFLMKIRKPKATFH